MNISTIRKNYLLHQVDEEETSNITDCSNNWLEITVKLKVSVFITIVYPTISESRLIIQTSINEPYRHAFDRIRELL